MFLSLPGTDFNVVAETDNSVGGDFVASNGGPWRPLPRQVTSG
jgi:hypothetical protein